MKTTFLIIMSGFVLALECPVTSATQNDAAVISRIDKSVAAIEAYRSKHPDKEKKYIINETRGKLELQEVPTDASANDSEASYYILFDDEGHVLSHSEEQTDSSGDWYELGTHYFDNNEQTILYKFDGRDFDRCTPLLKSNRQYYFDSNFHVLKITSSYTDEDNKPVDMKNCDGTGNLQDKEVIQSSYSNVTARIAKKLIEYQKNRIEGEKFSRELDAKNRKEFWEGIFYLCIPTLGIPALLYALFVSIRRRRSKDHS